MRYPWKMFHKSPAFNLTCSPGKRLPWQQLWRLQCEVANSLWVCSALNNYTEVQWSDHAIFSTLQANQHYLSWNGLSVFSVCLVAHALQANLSVSKLAHISSLTFAFLFNHNQPIMHSEMSHIPTLRIDPRLFTVGCVTNETVFGKRYNLHNCSVTVNNRILLASIHS